MSLATRGTVRWGVIVLLGLPACGGDATGPAPVTELIVANFDSHAITVYAANAGGDVAPLRTIAGAATGMGTPYDVAYNPATDEVIVSVATSIRIFAASGNVAPLRSIVGAATGLSGPVRVILR